jgi:diacylglycerol kinase family enzyme
MKCVIIYNPNSGRLSNRNDIAKIYKLFENYGYDVEVKFTEYKGHAKEIMKKLNNVDLVLCFDCGSGAIHIAGDNYVVVCDNRKCH